MSKEIMIQRLIKTLTPNEAYFVKAYLLTGDRVFRISVNALAKELGLSPGTIHDSLRLLEVAGCVQTEKSYKCTEVTILRRDRLKQIAEAYERGDI